MGETRSERTRSGGEVGEEEMCEVTVSIEQESILPGGSAGENKREHDPRCSK